MNKKVIIITIAICGCFESEGEFLRSVFDILGEKVVVTVYATVTAQDYIPILNDFMPVPNIAVNIKISKTGGETFTFSLITDQNGKASCLQVGYNLCEKQIITVTYQASSITDTKTLTYSTAFAGKTNDNSYVWSPVGLLQGFG